MCELLFFFFVCVRALSLSPHTTRSFTHTHTHRHTDGAGSSSPTVRPVVELLGLNLPRCYVRPFPPLRLTDYLPRPTGSRHGVPRAVHTEPRSPGIRGQQERLFPVTGKYKLGAPIVGRRPARRPLSDTTPRLTRSVPPRVFLATK